jgi:hypothetical protein
MEALRWAEMVFGIFGGLLMPFVALIDTSSGNFTGLVTALVLTIVTFAVCATTPSKPGYSALAYVAIFVILLAVGSVAVVAGLLLLVAALLGGLAAFFMRRSARVT